MKTIYYAHPMAYYGTEIEARDLATLAALGLKVLNPNHPQYQGLSMDGFVKLAKSCDAVAYRAFADGKIGSGVVLEVEAARAAGMPVIELDTRLPSRHLSRNETRGYMNLPPLRHPDRAPVGTFEDEGLDQDWGDK